MYCIFNDIIANHFNNIVRNDNNLNNSYLQEKSIIYWPNFGGKR